MSRGRRAKGRADDEGVSLGARSPEDDGHLGTQVWAIAPLLFGSGFCALVYQVGWQRELRLVFGASTAASAAVVAVFMGGLGLGGWFLGPKADRRPNPLRFYAALEALVALSAAATPPLLGLVRRAYLAAGGTVVLGPWGGTALRLALAGLVLLPTTFVAGGTLGAAARAIEHEGDPRRRATALLYGVNTLGAVAGCLAATFWLLEALGTRWTLWLAAVANLGVALLAGALSRRSSPVPDSPGEGAARERPEAAPPRFVLAAAAVVGFAFFLMELVWYRMLSPILGGTVYTFGLVLAVALAGIAAGGILYAIVFARRPVGLPAFAASCALEAAAIALPCVLGDRVALLALGLRPPTAAWRHSAIGAGRANALASRTPNAERAWVHDARRSVVWERDGVESSVAVQVIAGLSFVVNGKVDGNARNDAPTQVLGGLLGSLLRPGGRRSLVIGLGTGSTAGWLAAVPGMEQTDVVELEPAILEVARMCGPVNHDVMSNPRVRVITGDAREVLTVGRDTYDLVFSEPSNPYRAGIASLFTREFYDAVASRLRPEGLFLQWVQAYEVDEWTISTVAATLAAVFPEVEVWHVNHIDLLLVASRHPLSHDAAALRARIREEPFATALRGAWRVEDLEGVLARFVAGPALAKQMRAAGQEVNSDDRNPLEFAFARTLSRSGLFDVRRLREAARET